MRYLLYKVRWWRWWLSEPWPREVTGVDVQSQRLLVSRWIDREPTFRGKLPYYDELEQRRWYDPGHG